MIQRLLMFKGKTSVLCKNTLWLIIYGIYFRVILKKKYKIVNIKVFRFKDWHLGCKYFVGFNKQYKKNVFIKTCGRYDLIEREINAIDYVVNQSDKSKKYLPNLIAFNKKSKTPFLALEFIEGITLKDYLDELGDIDETSALSIINQLSELVEALNKSNIIHRDIRPANIMINLEDKRVCLIDFAFAISTQVEFLTESNIVLKYPQILETLGEEFKPKKYLWDDAYSINMIAEKIIGNYLINNPESLKTIKSKIGKLTYMHTNFTDKEETQ